MEALYLSLFCSKRILEQLRGMTNCNPGYAGQKFDRLVMQGLIKNGCSCEALSALPLNHHMSKKIWWNPKTETYAGIRIKYVPFINLPALKQLTLLIFSFFSILAWGMKKRREKVILADVLNFSICAGGMIAARLLGIKMIGVVTDMPGLMVNAEGKHDNFFSRFKSITSLMEQSVYNYDAYVFLTRQMDDVINRKHRPYIVMEGLVDSEIENTAPVPVREHERIILYAGGLHERYGLKSLVEAFMLNGGSDLRLWIYGSGAFVRDLEEKYMPEDPRIIYKGVVPNEEIIAAEQKATLLVNPRPTSEAFTLYSFPSKNMEYMASGRPLLTTNLPGMPEEYHHYVYLIEEESLEGYTDAISRVISLPPEEIFRKGCQAKKWILKSKNNIIQGKRILDLIRSLHKAN